MIGARTRCIFAGAVAAVLAALAGAPPASAQSETGTLHGSVSLSSEYILNGLSQTYDEPSVRVALDFEHQSGFFAGGVLANVGYLAEAPFETPRDTQASLYAGFLWRRNQWMTNLTASTYRYPGIQRSYDYTQAAASVSFRDRYFFAVSRSNDYLSIYDSVELYRAGIAMPLPRNLEFGINAGRFRADGFFGTSYSFWDVGVSRPMGRFALDLRYHDNTYRRYSLFGNDASDLWVLSMTYVFLPLNANRRRGPEPARSLDRR